ncbi:protein FAM96B [Uncinocarpus reesii 1704]|uniref:Protein FAM96B n=1 Tax=Uncinocarpus reesii (strain UAMH 1704) TaxID=336963 RepID=C4JID4_UNCRE|nr:protein FAM96B [Uncinocarpus reesii 1704]EEP76622.1 protein FAM96B [Uncinocarpus reesii 1704]
MQSVQNVNPKIISAADLPKRQSPHKATSPSGKDDLFDGTIFASSNFVTPPWKDDPFGTYLEEWESETNSIETDDDIEEPIDEQEIYDLISTIMDPEHPISLGELAVVSLPDISITPALPQNPSSPLRKVTVLVTPTITHCSLATVIGLGVRVRLEQSLPPRFRIEVKIKEGTHSTGEETNKQLADKERVAAAAENTALMSLIDKMLELCK